jgi:exosortase A
MSGTAIEVGAEDGRGTGWAPALLVLGFGLALLGAVFATEGAAALQIWETSTAYNHCWLIAPVAAWLAWERRHRLRGMRPAPAPVLALLALPLGLGWLLAERLGIMEGRQLMALGLAEVLVLAVLGRGFVRAMAAPLAYLVFLVPFGAFAVPLLQRITAWLIEFGLGLTSIPHYVDGLIIETPAGLFYVAEACAGLRFSIAALAFGALYAIVIFRSPSRRLAVLALAVAVPIVANGLRALGIVVLGHYLGSAEAAAADHLIYGWAFFSLVIILLILAGLPFREDGGREDGAREDAGPVAALPAGAPQRPILAHPILARPLLARPMVAGTLAVALAGLAPLLAAGLDRGAGSPQAVAVAGLIAPEGCEAVAAGLRCGPVLVEARLLAFPARVNWAAVAAARRQAYSGSDEDSTFALVVPGRALWQARLFADRSGAAATAAWLQGAPAGDGLRSRALQAWSSLRGGGAGGPVLATVMLRPVVGGSAPVSLGLSLGAEAALLRLVLEAQSGGMAAQAALLSGRVPGQP